MLQCKRGASNIWLRSQGTLYEREARASRALVDGECCQLHTLFQYAIPVAGSTLRHRIAGTVWRLDQLTTLRESTSGQTINAQQTMEQYSRMLRHLPGIVPQFNDSIDYPHAAGGPMALCSFMQGKELVGQERVLGVIGFIQGELNL